jgi:predicted glycosyltransferase
MSATRLLFYSHDTFGLGHFRRSLTIASHLRRHIPDAAVLIMTGLETAYAFESPPGIDFVKLPSVKKVGPEEYRSRHLRISFNRVRRLRENLLKAIAKSFDPHMLIVDNVPRGVDGELLSTIEFMRARRPQTRIVLTLRDVLDEPSEIVPLWRQWDVYGLLAQSFDEIWVVGAQNLFDPTVLYEFPDAVTAKTRFCGYIAQQASTQATANIQQELRLGPEPLVLASAGGGGDAYPLLSAFADTIDDLHQMSLQPIVFLGPDLPPAPRQDLKSRLLPRSDRVRVFDFRPDLVSFLPLAAVTVSMSGYNTVAELLAHQRRAVLVPRIYPRREQWLRANALEQRGLVKTVSPEALSPATLLEAMRAELATPAPPADAVDLGGLRRIARRTRRLLDLPDLPTAEGTS